MMTDGSPAQWLSVGLSLQLTLPREQGQTTCTSELLGWKEGAFLISELPFQDGRAVEFRAGAPCIVRYFLSGTVVGYRSEIRKGQFSPEPLLFLSFPRKIEQVVLRRHPRVRLDQPVSLIRVDESRNPAWPAPLVGTIKDLSIAGCRVLLHDAWREVPPGSQLRLDFELPGVGCVMNLSGLVRNAVDYPGKLVCGVEFQFDQTEYLEVRAWGTTAKQAIAQFVAQRQGALSSPAPLTG
ncbi:flagellar brake protein [Nitrospira sp. Kam-Ns4a]